MPVLAGSTVKYQFTTSGGDIEFSSEFRHNGGTEVLFASQRVPSDVEAHAGQFKAPRDGALLLRFDNNFSWFTPKLLSYQVELYQPAFTVADSARCVQSRALLSSTVVDTRKAEVSLRYAKTKLSTLGDEIPALEGELAALSARLTERRGRLDRAYAEAEAMSSRIEANLSKKSGLCLRCVLFFPSPTCRFAYI